MALILGKLNIVTEKEYQLIHVDIERMFLPRTLNWLLKHLFYKPEMDYFVTSNNTLFGGYTAFRTDLWTINIDALSIEWLDLKFCAFLPMLPVLCIPSYLSYT